MHFNATDQHNNNTVLTYIPQR